MSTIDREFWRATSHTRVAWYNPTYDVMAPKISLFDIPPVNRREEKEGVRINH
jgi:hypothetical protein